VHITNASPFLKTSAKARHRRNLEVKNEVLTSNKKKMLIVATVAITLVLIAYLPYTYASISSTTASATQSSQTRTLRAKGIAVNQGAVTPAGFALSLQATQINATTIEFNVVSGTVDINGTQYTIAGGSGAVVREKHGFVLEAQGTSPDGQSVTLKLAGRYFWMWGRLYVARIAGSLQTGNAKIYLVLRAAIRV